MKYGLYIHFPFCIHKCFYCDFYSIENTKLIDDFVAILVKEIELRATHYENKNFEIDTIFFGGGTPSLLNPNNLEEILDKINKYFIIDRNAEITLECNPGTVDVEYLSEYYKMGINRISFGVQSFVDSELKFLERIHSSDEVVIAYNKARQIGFDNISLDLIFSLPNQEIDNWKFSLNKAIELNPNHISAYSLIYEPGTPLFASFQKGKIKKNTDDRDVEFYEITTDVLSNANFEQYEVSNYAKDGKYCRHNLKYWNCNEYFAFGPSAVGVIDGFRFKNFSNLNKYNTRLKQNKLPVESTEVMTENVKIFERIFLTLRAIGLNTIEFNKEFNIDIFEIAKREIELLINNKFIFRNGDILRLTSQGYFIGDDITLMLIDAIEKNSDFDFNNH